LAFGIEQTILKCTKSCDCVISHALNLVGSRVS
jgi:hypothetical protein